MADNEQLTEPGAATENLGALAEAACLECAFALVLAATGDTVIANVAPMTVTMTAQYDKRRASVGALVSEPNGTG